MPKSNVTLIIFIALELVTAKKIPGATYTGTLTYTTSLYDVESRKGASSL